MLIAGIEPFTLLDFPGKIACILFTLGCNFKCGYCHNAQFVKPQKDEFSKNKIIVKTKGIRDSLYKAINFYNLQKVLK